MFPTGYNIPFPPYYNAPNMSMMGTGIRNAAGLTGASRGINGLDLFSKFGGIRTINWQGLLNGASKTLGIVNQAIPIVKQVGPMYNNMKSMLRVASLFKDETDPTPIKNTNNVNKTNNNITNKDNINATTKENTIINSNYSNSPNFFI